PLTSQLQGGELSGLRRLANRGAWRAGLLGGFRYLNLRETLTFDTSSPNLAPPSVFVSRDEFGAENNFYGGQFGGRFECGAGNAFVALTGKVALGIMQESVRVNGGLLTNDLNNFGPVQAFPGGYFALPSNG